MSTADHLHAETLTKRAPAYVVYSAWSILALSWGDFLLGDVGWLAAIPVALLVYAVIREQSVRPLRWWVGASAILFAIPYFTEDSGQGWMHDMHPVNLALFLATVGVVLAKLHRSHRG